MSKKIALNFVQIVILIIFLTIGFITSVKAPLLTGRDELAHFRFTRFLVENDHLPVTWEERKEAGYKAEWPPLFHLVVGIVGQGIDTNSPPFVDTRLTENNPRVQLVFGPDNVRFARALVTEEPYQGELLLWYIGRWVTLFTGAIGLIFTYVLIRSEWVEHNWLALSAVATLAFTLSYVRDSSVISYDPLLAIPIVLYLLLLFFTVRNPLITWYYFGLGFLIGLAGLTKYTPLPAVLVVPILINWFAHQHQWTGRTTVFRMILFGFGLFLTFGSWMLYMWFFFNQVTELGWFSGSLYPFLADNLAVGDQTSQWFAGLVIGEELTKTDISRGDASFFIWIFSLLINIFGNQWLAWGFLILFGLALVGLIRQWFGSNQTKRLKVVLLIVHFGLFLLFPVLRFFSVGEVNTNTVAGQHVIFPVGAIVLLLLLIGLDTWLTISHSTILFSVIAGLCLLQTVLFSAKFETIPFPIQSTPLFENEQALAEFGEISLIDYQYEFNRQLLTTTLFWRANQFLAEDYYIELTLLSSQNQPQARWIGQPLNGRYPTRAWIKGDRIRDTISLPVGNLQKGDYLLQLRILNDAKQPIGDSPFKLGVAAVDASVQLVGDTLLLNGMNIRYNIGPKYQPTETLPLYEERATVTLATSEKLPNNIQVKLVSSNDGKAYEPIDHTGNVYNFIVEPYFVSGQYRFRFESWSNNYDVQQVETTNLLQIKTAERLFEIGPVSSPIQANFAGHVALIGYDLPQRKIKADDKLPITLYWKALTKIGADLITFNRLINEKQQVFGEKDRLVRGVYSTLLWAPNEIVPDSFEIEIAPDAPDGIYYFFVGLYLPVGESAVSLPLLQNGELTDLTNVRLGPIKVGQTPSHLIIDQPDPQHVVEHTLGDESNLKLIGYDLEQSALTLYWQLISPLAIDYTTFVHIRNEAGEIVAQKDQSPLKGAYPTGLWDVGEMIADEIVISLPNNLPTGKYPIIIGMYDFETGQRLNIPNNPENEIVLTLNK